MCVSVCECVCVCVYIHRYIHVHVHIKYLAAETAISGEEEVLSEALAFSTAVEAGKPACVHMVVVCMCVRKRVTRD